MTREPHQAANALRNWAQGWLPYEAAVELLIAHDTWLHRSDFLDRFLVDEGDAVWPDWHQAAAIVRLGVLPSTETERQVLGIACELAGYSTGWTWDRLLTGLDRHNTKLVLDAVAHATGHPEAGTR